MKISALVVCLVAAWAVVHAEDDEEPSLFEKFMSAVGSCKEEAGEGLNMGECFKTYVDGGDTNTPEFNKCKCAGACMSQKLATLKDDASWDWAEMKNLNEQVKAFDEDMYNENLKVAEKCNDETVGGATDKCEAAFKLFECSIKNSEMVKGKMEMVANSMS